MRVFKIKKSCVLLAFSLLVCALNPEKAFTESFRVRKTAVINLSAISAGEVSATAGINDAIEIILPEDLTFIQGIELNIKIPTPVARCPNTIIYSLYENISPVPSAKTIDYTGKELYTGVYPGQLSLTVLIPLVKGNTIKKTPYADKTLIPEHSRNFIFLRNQLAMKGVPQDVLNAEFIVSAKPILLNKGRLLIKTDKVPQDLSVTIDDKQIELGNDGSCFVKPGIHNVIISADGSRNENRSCMIEEAKTTVIKFSFQSTDPTMDITMPQGTTVMVDNEIVDVKNNAISITPGEHTLRFTLGGYEIVKNVVIQEGRNYSINISLDVDFNEN